MSSANSVPQIDAAPKNEGVKTTPDRDDDVGVEPVWSLPEWDSWPGMSLAPLPPLSFSWPTPAWPFHWPSFHFPWSSTTTTTAPTPAIAAQAHAQAQAQAQALASQEAVLRSLSHATALATPTIELDVLEQPHRFVVTAEAPGVRAADIDVRVVDAHARVVRVSFVRRRNANCDCNFADDCEPVRCHVHTRSHAHTNTCKCAGTKTPPPTPITSTTTTAPTTTAGIAPSAGAPAIALAAKDGVTKAQGGKCDGQCKAAAGSAHCHDCEVKGETTAVASAMPSSALVPGCCGHCAGALGRASAAPPSGGGPNADRYVYRRSERVFGRAQRSFRVAADVDLGGISCSLRHGVLTLVLPRIASAPDLADASHTAGRIPVRVDSDADRKVEADAKAQFGKAVAQTVAVAADAKKRTEVLSHHITRSGAGADALDHPLLAHERVMRQAVAAARNPRLRARYHLMRGDPLSTWAYGSPVSAYDAMLHDALELVRDFDLVSHHITPPNTNPLLLHEQVMRHAIAVANAKALKAGVGAGAGAGTAAPVNAPVGTKSTSTSVGTSAGQPALCTCDTPQPALPRAVPPEGASAAFIPVTPAPMPVASAGVTAKH